VPISQLLADLGYAVRAGIEREQQFACDLHGDGNDNKPSARCYPDTNTFYCFACSKVRDVIELVREKKGVEFVDAVTYLEKTYNLPAVPWDASDQRPEKVIDEIQDKLEPNRTFGQDGTVFQSILMIITKEKQLPMQETLSFWEAYDHLCFMVSQKKMSEQQGRSVLLVLRNRLKDATS
jgi:DNA primase